MYFDTTFGSSENDEPELLLTRNVKGSPILAATTNSQGCVDYRVPRTTMC